MFNAFQGKANASRVMHNSFDDTSMGLPPGFDSTDLKRNYNERMSGFDCPWHLFQLIAAIFFFTRLVTTSGIMFPILYMVTTDVSKILRVVVVGILIFFIIVTLVVLYQAYIVTNENPIDPLVLKQRYLKHYNIAFETFNAHDGKTLDLYCSVCEAFV